MSGLLINGSLYQVPGVEVLSAADVKWARLDSGDCRPRSTSWVRQITIHTTKGKWPQHVKPGAGPGGKDRATADYWAGDPQHGGCHLIVDNDGSVACLADLVKIEAYHATTVNAWSVGIEMYQEADGGIYEAVLASTVKLVLTLCDVLGIPLQSTSRIYKDNEIVERLRDGGKDVVGVFGHRDNAWQFPQWMPPAQRAKYPNGYASRGKGDPGEEIYLRLKAVGMMTFDIDAKAEQTFWKPVQDAFNSKGESLDVDGVCGPGTVAALRKHGLWNGGVFLEQPIM
jgi:hypothetical protein